MHFKFISSITEVAASEWDALWPSAYPFCKHAFLAALEQSGSTTRETGWQAVHCIACDNGALVFAMPLFLKTHSYGEYVFDWAWADAYAQAGLDYYPKLLNAIPFTPATGPRFSSALPLTADETQQWQQAIKSQMQALSASSFHSLFPSPDNSPLFKSPTFTERQGHQFHWFNQGYKQFDDFLADLSSRKRKNIRKERQKVEHYNVEFIEAADISEADLVLFYHFYHRTYFKRSGRPGYLNEDFFNRLVEGMPKQVCFAFASLDGEKRAGAVYFKDDTCLYGRYWGTLEDIDGLHFEVCYYRGIEYAIKHGLSRFDPGAQGEHKIQRGFQPIVTHSYHQLTDPRFHSAVANFCTMEAKENARYVESARDYLPFKEGHTLIDSTILITE